ncbi:MAG: putative sulfate exporter family transporter [Alphaproteobacteria bacterium]|nr:putative sulfate exporter family transporter [Alphaproteobacteria bacterium]
MPLVFAIQGWEHQARKKRAGGEEEHKARPRYPWFILGFLGMAALVTYVPVLAPAGHVIEGAARHVLVATLCLIGAGLSRESLREVGAGPLLQGVILWVIVASLSLYAVYAGIIS